MSKYLSPNSRRGCRDRAQGSRRHPAQENRGRPRDTQRLEGIGISPEICQQMLSCALMTSPGHVSQVLLLDHPKKKIRDTQKYKPFRKTTKVPCHVKRNLVVIVGLKISNWGWWWWWWWLLLSDKAALPSIALWSNSRRQGPTRWTFLGESSTSAQ